MRLKDADALLERFNEKVGSMAECLMDEKTAERFAIFCKVADAIDAVPTIDAVPVVRCKDCLHYRPMVAFDGECMCDVFQWKSEPMDYCSFAERKEVQECISKTKKKS